MASTSPDFTFLRQLRGAPTTLTMKQLVRNYCASDSLQDRLIQELGWRKAMSIKEILEAYEFFARVRSCLRAPQVADVCCGHGLVGLLFALFERDVERVALVDKRRPKSHALVLEAAIAVGPWVADKVVYHEAGLTQAAQLLAPGTSVASVHACGALTDRTIGLAMQVGGSVAVMPCCCHPRQPDAPEVLHRALGGKLAVDIHRTYRLEGAGYQVLWREIPEQITPMNRVIIGRLRRDSPTTRE